MIKNSIEEYTESAFLDRLREFDEGYELQGDAYAEYRAGLVEQFVKVVEHPAGTDLIFYPEPGAHCTPEGWLADIKAWMIETANQDSTLNERQPEKS